jgi:hypothetical protein
VVAVVGLVVEDVSQDVFEPACLLDRAVGLGVPAGVHVRAEVDVAQAAHQGALERRALMGPLGVARGFDLAAQVLLHRGPLFAPGEGLPGEVERDGTCRAPCHVPLLILGEVGVIQRQLADGLLVEAGGAAEEVRGLPHQDVELLLLLAVGGGVTPAVRLIPAGRRGEVVHPE